MVTIRYVREHIIAHSFNHASQQDHRDDKHGLQDYQVESFQQDPKFEVLGAAGARTARNVRQQLSPQSLFSSIVVDR